MLPESRSRAGAHLVKAAAEPPHSKMGQRESEIAALAFLFSGAGAPGCEEILQQRNGLFGVDTFRDFNTMVRAIVA
jgi:hypothetical protein